MWMFELDSDSTVNMVNLDLNFTKIHNLIDFPKFVYFMKADGINMGLNEVKTIYETNVCFRSENRDLFEKQTAANLDVNVFKFFQNLFEFSQRKTNSEYSSGITTPSVKSDEKNKLVAHEEVKGYKRS